jgi:signal transduction histidine kinase
MIRSDHRGLFTAIELIILVIMACGVYQQSHKATLPPWIDRKSIDAFAGTDLQGPSVDVIEILLDQRSIGDTVTVTHHTSVTPQIDSVTLVPYYRTSMLMIVSVVSLVFLVIASFVRRRRPADHAAQVFYGLCITVGVLISCSTGSLTVLTPALSSLMRAVFFSAYGVAPVLLVHFAIAFTSTASSRNLKIIVLLYAASLLLALDHTILDHMVGQLEVGAFYWFDLSYLVTHVWFAVLSVASLVIVVNGYRIAENLSERRRILWVLFGIAVSVVSYLAFWSIPLLAFGRSVLPEDAIVALTVVAPIAFAIAIIRYRALDIDVIVRIGLVHGAAIILALLTYTLIVTIALRYLDSDQIVLEYIIPAIIIMNVLLFAPVRGVIQRLVDRMFFRVEYDYRNTLRSTLSSIRETLSSYELADIIHRRLLHVLQPTFVRVVLIDGAHAQPTQVGNTDSYDVVLKRELVSKRGEQLGRIEIGAKRSQQNYTDEDVDLMNTISAECEIQMDRFQLHRSLRTEHEKAEHEATLNKLKSVLVSGVSHDLKTPLTSIRMYAELLERQVHDPQGKRYLQMIEGESERLARLVDNVLDYAKIERGVMEYDRREVDVNELVRRSVELMEYQIELNGFKIDVALYPEKIISVLDGDALQNVVINLISNAIKYSRSVKHIAVTTTVDGDVFSIAVADRGIGIPLASQQEIFLAFVRVKDPSTQGAGGAGLGLALVNHFVLAHHGRIVIDSTPGEGTTITLILPFE